MGEKIIITPGMQEVEFKSMKFKVEHEYDEKDVKYLKAIFEILQNPENWKLPPIPVKVKDIESAFIIAEALEFFLGGAEIEEIDDMFVVTSEGYYHYTGA